jgi:hypothetical protein
MKTRSSFSRVFIYLVICVSFIFLTGFVNSSQVNAAAKPAIPNAPNAPCYESGHRSGTTTWGTNCIHVVMYNLIVDAGATLVIQPQTIVKIDMGVYIDVFGTLDLQGSKDHEVVFTSYRDDTYGGDTNGDGKNTNPAPGDWYAIYLRNSSTTFHNSFVRYGNLGVVVYNTSSVDINPTIIQNTFEKNTFGLNLVTASNSNITSKVENNIFTGNKYGVVTNQPINQNPDTFGTALPEISNNDFNNNTGLPIFLGGSAMPTYTGNTFIGYPTANQRLGIGLGGRFYNSGTFPIINNMPYVVLANTLLDRGAVITIPEGSVFKFDTGFYLETKESASLIVQGSAQNGVVFTSLRDDTIGGDANGDGSDLEPLPGDWDTIYIENSTSSFQFATVKYSDNGLTIWNNSNADIDPPISNSTFTRNNYGIQLNNCGSGNITSPITNNQFTSNQYGLVTSQCPLVTGTSRPILSLNHFTANTALPIYLSGSAFPVYSSNVFVGYPTNPQRLGIGLSGAFTQDGTWDLVNNMPYVVLGNTNVSLGSTVTLLQNLIIKFNTDTYLEGKGAFYLQSTPASNIIFTSFKDDVGGDTNGDGTVSQPMPGDWVTLYLDNDLTDFHDAILKYATAGLTIYNPLSNTLNTNISRNTFALNKTALTYTECGNGIIYGSLSNNSFIQNSEIPIILNGTTFPDYNNNIFADNIHPAIALSGSWNASGTWPQVLGQNSQIFPYVAIRAKNCNGDLNGGIVIKPTYAIDIPGSTVIKLDRQVYIDVIGSLVLESSPSNEIIFTSYFDDTYKGDTNADADLTHPAVSDWDTIYLESSDTNFHDAIVKYSDKGVNVYNQVGSDINPTITHNHFEQNKYGVLLSVIRSGDITSAITNNEFIKNTYGLGTYVEPPNIYHYFSGINLPTLSDNSFSQSSDFPLFYNGSTQPEYSANIFTQNAHPAIAVGGYWGGDLTWLKLNGDNNKIFPYVVKVHVTQDYFSNLTLPDGLIVKFDHDIYFYAFGMLNLQSTAQSPIIFTSYLDDSYAGDTNGDGVATQPAPSDWKTVWLIDTPSKTNQIHNIIARYATAAIGIYYDGFANTAISTGIIDCTFENNHVGVTMAIGWSQDVPGSGAGRIISTISGNTVFQNNHYGLVTYAHSQSTGYSMPTLSNVQFINNLVYPIYLGGTSFPQFASGNSIISTMQPDQVRSLSLESASPQSLELSFPDSPSIQALRADNARAVAMPLAQPQSIDAVSGSLSITGSLAPAIGLGGVFNNMGTLFQQDNLSYAVVGNYPLLFSLSGAVDPVNNNVLVGYKNPGGSSITFLPGTVVKFNPTFYFDVFGKLDLQGTLSKPVIFTSIKDDSVGGDTNLDGSRTLPLKGDWMAIFLESSQTVFSNAVVKYATDGLNIYFGGAINTNINPEVKSSIFAQNVTGLTLQAINNGDILSDIHNNLFMDNTSDIVGRANLGIGRLMVNIHDNDLMGTTTYGINNISTNYAIQAQNNYWGDPTGPLHATNLTGKGVPVSDRVIFNPWQSAKNFNVTFSIIGRVLNNDKVTPLQGVIVHLSNGMTSTTNVNGIFNFSGLAYGNYGVTPILSGYVFTQGSVAVNTPPDATSLTFYANLSAQPTYKISGLVREYWGMPVSGVIITNDNGDSTVTGNDGSYTFPNLLAKTYKITPIFTGYTFTPTFLTVTIGPDKLNQNFKLNAVYGIHFFNFLPRVKK